MSDFKMSMKNAGAHKAASPRKKKSTQSGDNQPPSDREKERDKTEELGDESRPVVKRAKAKGRKKSSRAKERTQEEAPTQEVVLDGEDPTNSVLVNKKAEEREKQRLKEEREAERERERHKQQQQREDSSEKEKEAEDKPVAPKRTVLYSNKNPDETIYTGTSLEMCEVHRSFMTRLALQSDDLAVLKKQHKLCVHEMRDVELQTAIEQKEFAEDCAEAYRRMYENMLRLYNPFCVNEEEFKKIRKNPSELTKIMQESNYQYICTRRALYYLEDELTDFNRNMKVSDERRTEFINPAKEFSFKGSLWCIPVPIYVVMSKDTGVDGLTLVNFSPRSIAVKMRITNAENFFFTPRVTKMGPFECVHITIQHVPAIKMDKCFEHLTVYFQDYEAARFLFQCLKEDFDLVKHFIGKFTMPVVVYNYSRRRPYAVKHTEATEDMKVCIDHAKKIAYNHKTLCSFFNSTNEEMEDNKDAVARIRTEPVTDFINREVGVYGIVKRLEEARISRLDFTDKTVYYRRVEPFLKKMHTFLADKEKAILEYKKHSADLTKEEKEEHAKKVKELFMAFRSIHMIECGTPNLMERKTWGQKNARSYFLKDRQRLLKSQLNARTDDDEDLDVETKARIKREVDEILKREKDEEEKVKAAQREPHKQEHKKRPKDKEREKDRSNSDSSRRCKDKPSNDEPQDVEVSRRQGRVFKATDPCVSRKM